MSTKDPLRERIVAAFALRMKAKRASTVIDELPARSVWDSVDTSMGRPTYGQVDSSMSLTVEAVVEADHDPKQWSQQGNRELARLIAQATGSDRTLSGLCDDIRYASGTIYYPEDGSHVLGVDATFEIAYRFDIGDPYTNSQQ